MEMVVVVVVPGLTNLHVPDFCGGQVRYKRQQEMTRDKAGGHHLTRIASS